MSRPIPVILLLAMLACAPVASAAPTGRYDAQSIRLDRDDHAAGGTTQPAATQPARSATAGGPSAGGGGGAPGQLDWPRVLVSLGAVIGLIVLMRVAMKKWLGAAAVGGAGRSVRVLGRTVLGPRQQVLLLQVGRRVVVMADSAGQLSALAQITDADEVAALIGSVESAASAEVSAEALEGARGGGFGRFLGAARQPFVGTGRADATADRAADEDEDDEAAALAPAGLGPATGGAGDPSIDAARGELAGLMDKIRGLSRQFRRSD